MLFIYIIASFAIANTATAQNFTVVIPPVILQPVNTTELFYKVAERGEPSGRFELPCIAGGSPQPVYSWIKDGRTLKRDTIGDRVTQEVGTGTLIFSSGREIDAGNYQCVAENEGGVATSVPITLTKAFLGNFADTLLKMIYADEGKPMKLECNPPSGIPKPETLWLIQTNDGMVSSINNSRITFDPIGNLWFSYVEATDESASHMTYVCTSTSEAMAAFRIGSRVKLNVRKSRNMTTFAPVQQYTSPSSLMVFAGSNVDLHCIYGGNPTPNTTWEKDERTISADYRVKFTDNNRVVKIKNVALNDTGIYICRASNGVIPSQNHTINLEVQSKPQFIDGFEPMARMVSEGDDVSFECKAGGVPLPTIEWLYNSAPLRNTVPNSRRIVTETSLSITNVQKSDIGTYSCVASNGHGTVIKHGYVSVSSIPPTAETDPVNATATAGEVAELNCLVVGVPTPQIEWLRFNELIISARFERVNGTKLKIYNVQQSDGGDYTCRATNKFGTLSLNMSLTVQSVFKITNPPIDKSAVVGDWMTLACGVESSRNDVEITWMKDNVFISFEVMPRIIQGLDGSITIFKLISNDAGVYTCVARSGLEERRASATLTITLP